MYISIVIVSFNTKDTMKITLDSLIKSINFAKKANNSLFFETIVVDNNSTDGVIDLIKRYDVKLIENKYNLGFSKANNLGVKAASKKSKYILFLNNDVKLNEDTLSETIKYIEKEPHIGIVTCRVDLWTGGIDIDCHRAFPNVWNSFCYFFGLEKRFGKIFPRIFGQYHMLSEDLESIHEVDVCLGAFMLVRRDVGDSINWWPEDYFLNGEDIDFCYQIKIIKKYRIVYYPKVTIIHFKGAAKGTKAVSRAITKASEEVKLMQVEAGTNAMKIFYEKYYKRKNIWFVNFIVILGIKLLYFLRKTLKSE